MPSAPRMKHSVIDNGSDISFITSTNPKATAVRKRKLYTFFHQMLVIRSIRLLFLIVIMTSLLISAIKYSYVDHLKFLRHFKELDLPVSSLLNKDIDLMIEKLLSHKKERRIRTSQLSQFGYISQPTSISDTAESMEEVQIEPSEFLQPIDGNSSSVVFSAFFDTHHVTGRPVVIVFGITPFLPPRVTAHCFTKQDGVISYSEGVYQAITDAHRKKTTKVAVRFTCPIKPGARPQSVSIKLDLMKLTTNQVPILYSGPWLRTFTVCYAILYDFNEPKDLITSIEFNRVLGAEHFFLYNHSVSLETDQVLRYYKNQGILTVIQWQNPPENVWYKGQLGVINDCVYRNKNVSEFVVIQDTDEFIIPINHDSWKDLMTAALNPKYQVCIDHYPETCDSTKNVGSFSFQNAFFFRRPQNGSTTQKVEGINTISSEQEKFFYKHSILPLLYYKRGTYILTFPKRSKTIVRPDWILEAGIHTTHKHRNNAITKAISTKIAVLHHHTTSRKGIIYSMMDTSALRFKDLVYPRLKTAMARILGVS